MLAFLASELAYCKMLSNTIKMESNYLNLKQINGLCEFNLVEIILENWKRLYNCMFARFFTKITVNLITYIEKFQCDNLIILF